MSHAPDSPARSRSARRWLVVVAVAVALLAALFLLTRGPGVSLPGLPADEDAAVEEGAEAPDLAASPARPRSFPAQLQPAASRMVAATSAGGHLRWLVAPQQMIEEGQVIAELSQSGQAERLAQAEARLGVARHQVRTIGHLVAEGYEPQSNLDRAQAQLDAATAEVEAAQQAAPAIRISSPVAGLVLRLLHQEGASVDAGQELAQVALTRDLLVVADVDAQAAGTLRTGQAVNVMLGEQALQGLIRRIGSAGQPGSAQIEVALTYAPGVPLDGAPVRVIALAQGR